MSQSNIVKIAKIAFPPLNLLNTISFFENKTKDENENNPSVDVHSENMNEDMNRIVSEESITKNNEIEFEYDSELNNKKNKVQVKFKLSRMGPMFFFGNFVQLVLFILAIYLSFKCNKGFNLFDFLIACCCSHCYIVYRLAVPCKSLNQTVNNVIKNINTKLNTK